MSCVDNAANDMRKVYEYGPHMRFLKLTDNDVSWHGVIVCRVHANRKKQYVYKVPNDLIEELQWTGEVLPAQEALELVHRVTRKFIKRNGLLHIARQTAQWIYPCQVFRVLVSALDLLSLGNEDARLHRALLRCYQRKHRCIMPCMHACYHLVLEKEASRRAEAHHAKTIQRQWREAISNPEFVLCRRRLLREFGELCE